MHSTLVYKKMDFSQSLSQTRYQPLSIEKSLRNSQYLRIFLLLGVIFVYSLGLIYLAPSLSSKCTNNRFVYSPAENAIDYHRITIDGDAVNKYKGSPSPELDKAWLDLLHGFKIRVTAEELDAVNRTSTNAEDGEGGYLATLDVFHHLHCLWNVRHFLAPDYYKDQVDQHITKPGEIYPTHIDHCLDLIRQHLMCQGDISMYTYDYMETDRTKIMPNFKVERMCMNWEHLAAWIEKRSY
ncbi:unnamed protein product [Periconia digitata]|uniref:Cyclochlorotine biosynthesis protein O n=1 Tax=Periconia digitata TaxID=1303443 RepID=A0A9W4UUJ4_9PLEO|nr:unnamed protein product [Periconia digitata]